MKVTFWGAAEQVTGSMYLLQTDGGSNVLIDCGLNIDRRKANYPKKHNLFPIEPSYLDAVLLTHAHIDHSGNIPNLYKHQFEGKIYSTLPTYYLTQLLLADSANLNGKRLNQAAARNSPKLRKNIMGYDDFYLEQQVRMAAKDFEIVPFRKRIEIKNDLRVTFFEAGHLLGAAHLIVEVYENNSWKSISFSGDIGRQNAPLLVNPFILPQTDFLVCESTYGGRYHQTEGNASVFLADIVNKTCVEKPGRLIIPAFSVGRTQAILYTLQQLAVTGMLPKIPVYLDSPLAYESTKAYDHLIRFLNTEAKEFKTEYGELFTFDQLEIITNPEDSRQIANHFEPCIIVSSSGMLEGGRIQYHIAQNIGNPYATILMVGYSVAGTLGHQLAQNMPKIYFDGRGYTVNAKILKTDIFSGHADQTDLLSFVKNQIQGKLQQIFLVHGDPEALTAFENEIKQLGFSNITIPTQGQQVVL